MLDINFIKLREGFLQYFPFGALLGLVLLIEVFMIFLSDKLSDMSLVEYSQEPIFKETENTIDIGLVLYTDYFYLFQLSGLILLVAMIGSIVLTLRQREGLKKQSVNQQVNTNAKTAIEKKVDNFISSGIEWHALNQLDLKEDQYKSAVNLLESLEEDDDVQNVYTNLKEKN